MPDTATQHVLTVDVGNTTTRLGLFCVRGARRRGAGAGANATTPDLLGTCELTTPARITSDEARIQVAQALHVLPSAEVNGAMLSCVVPALTETWRRALEALSPTRPLVVGPGLKTGVRMRYDDPSEVGPDRIADVVAARSAYGAPVVVVDLGTTTNFEVVDATGAFAGGIIAPGIALGAQALAQAAARLPQIELAAPAHVIGTSTRAAMQSGVVFGEVARIDGLLTALMAELGEEAPVVLTGSDAERIQPLLRHTATVDETLTLRGLALLWQNNRR